MLVSHELGLDPSQSKRHSYTSKCQRGSFGFYSVDLCLKSFQRSAMGKKCNKNTPCETLAPLVTLILTKVQAEQLADLNGKLRLVEKLRDENSDREAEIARVLRQQQDQR